METRFFADGTVPEFTTASWYATRERAPHLEQPGHRERLLLAATMVNEAIGERGLATVSDMGCGDGGLLTLIRGAECWGYDLQPSNVAGGRERGVDVRLGDATGAVRWGDLAVCTEMLEHLVDPHAFLATVPSRVVIASSPNGETVQSHYEFHAWGWDMDGYRALFEAAGWRVERHETVGGFQVLRGAR
ncbi:MAG: class I SAM-dependent methyltransferase [Acidiferrobacteraceae bacterium]